MTRSIGSVWELHAPTDQLLITTIITLKGIEKITEKKKDNKTV